jgi:hypothetical protein
VRHGNPPNGANSLHVAVRTHYIVSSQRAPSRDSPSVDHGGAGRGLATDPLPVGHDEQVVHALEQAGIAPCRELTIYRGPGRQIVREEPPGDAATQHVEDRVQNLAKRPRPWSPKRLWRRHERLDESPLGIGQVGFVAQMIAAMLPPSGRGPHGCFQVRFPAPSWNQPNPSHSTLPGRVLTRDGTHRPVRYPDPPPETGGARSVWRPGRSGTGRIRWEVVRGHQRWLQTGRAAGASP